MHLRCLCAVFSPLYPRLASLAALTPTDDCGPESCERLHLARTGYGGAEQERRIPRHRGLNPSLPFVDKHQTLAPTVLWPWLCSGEVCYGLRPNENNKKLVIVPARSHAFKPVRRSLCDSQDDRRQLAKWYEVRVGSAGGRATFRPAPLAGMWHVAWAMLGYAHKSANTAWFGSRTDVCYAGDSAHQASWKASRMVASRLLHKEGGMQHFRGGLPIR